MCKVPEIAVNLQQWTAILLSGIFFHLMRIISHIYQGILMSSVLLFSTLRYLGAFLGRAHLTKRLFIPLIFPWMLDSIYSMIFESMKFPDTFQWESGDVLLFQAV